MPTPDEYLNFAEDLMAEGRDEDARVMLEAYDRALAEAAVTKPMMRATRATASFEDSEAVAARRKERIAEEAEEAVLLRAMDDDSVEGSIAEEVAKRTAEADRERSRVVMAGREDPVELEGAIFRGSRIMDMPGYMLPGQTVEGQGVLADTPENRRLLAARQREAMTVRGETPVGIYEQTPDFFPQVTGRRYLDPETGLATVPTVAQERREAFALQTERSEAGMRADERALAMQQKELDRRIAEDPDSVSWYEKYVGSPGMALAEVFTDPVEGTGVVETPLMATLRSTMGYLSALAAEGYFRGLGYEVDEMGVPIDPDDFGYWLATQRRTGGALAGELGRKLGLDESAEYIETLMDDGIMYPQAVVKGIVTPLVDAGVDPEYVSTFTNFIESVLPVSAPMPGVATESTTRKTTTFDPEGRRRVEDMIVPDFLEDPEGWFDAERARIWQNVAKGRTWGDEYLDTPAMREHYARVTGDADDAYIAGMLPEILLPAGPELLAGPAGYVIGRIADGARFAKGITRSKALIQAKKAVDVAQDGIKTARRTGEGMAEAQAKLKPALDRYKMLIEAPGDYDAGMLRRITVQAARKVGLVDEDIERITHSFKWFGGEKRVKAITLGDIYEKVKDVVGPEVAGRITQLVKKNIPGDYVMLTDVIAVPRAALKEAKQNLNMVRSRLFLYRADEMLGYMIRVGKQLPEGKVRDQFFRTLDKAYDNIDADGFINKGIMQVENSLDYGWQAFPKGYRAELQQALKAASRELGDVDPAMYVKRFDQRPPNHMTEIPNSMMDALSKYERWDDVPASLRREVINAYDFEFPSHFAKGARRAQDVTRAQMWFESAERSVGALNKLFSSRLFGPTALGRKLRGRFGKLETETFAMARAGKEIKAKATTALRTLREQFLDAVKKTGNVDEALDYLLKQSFSFATRADVGKPPLEIYDKIFGHLYGEFKKNQVLDAAQSADLLNMETTFVKLPDGTDDLVTELAYPTVQNLRAIDEFFSSAKGGDLLPGMGILPPDFHFAILKTILEDSIKPLLSKETLDILRSGAAPRSVSIGGANGRTDLRKVLEDLGSTAEQFAERQKQALPFPSAGHTEALPARMDSTFGQRMMVYDTNASFVENALAKGGEELFQIVDDIPVRAREDFLKMAGAWISDKAVRARRDFFHRLQYGWIVPNIMGQGAELLKQAVVPLVTIGARDAIGATKRMVAKVAARRKSGGGLTTPDGVHYTPKMLDDLAESYGVGRTGLEQARTGSLAHDMYREAKLLEQGIKGKVKTPLNEFGNPLTKGYFLRLAEAIELNFRKSVFEMALVRGDAPTEAADLARRSQLDFAALPDALQQYAAPYFAQSGALYQFGADMLGAVLRNPQKATMLMKGMRMKAEAQDPYNVYGDAALKSLGMVGVTDNEWGDGKMTFFPPQGDVYFLPELPIFAAPEALLFGARNVDLFIDDMRFAYGLRGASGAVDEAFEAGLAEAIPAAADMLVPSILDAYDRFSEGEAYQTQGVPKAEPMSDEKVFWALALKARQNDPNGQPGGEWTNFLNKYQPEFVPPPSGMGGELNPLAWKQQPPEGTPHVLYDITDKGEPLYYVFKPSVEGVKQIRTWRLLRPEVIEQALVAYTLLDEQGAREAPPRAVYPQPVLADDVQGAVTEALLPKAMPVQEARRQQSELLRAIRQPE